MSAVGGAEPGLPCTTMRVGAASCFVNSNTLCQRYRGESMCGRKGMNRNVTDKGEQQGMPQRYDERATFISQKMVCAANIVVPLAGSRFVMPEADRTSPGIHWQAKANINFGIWFSDMAHHRVHLQEIDFSATFNTEPGSLQHIALSIISLPRIPAQIKYCYDLLRDLPGHWPGIALAAIGMPARTRSFTPYRFHRSRMGCRP